MLVARSQQQSRNLAIIRNLDSDAAEYVQRYEQQSSLKSSGLGSRTGSRTFPAAPAARPAAPAARPAPPPPKIERRKFNVLLRTAGGFDETGMCRH